jgi:hypothetical protein
LFGQRLVPFAVAHKTGGLKITTWGFERNSRLMNEILHSRMAKLSPRNSGHCYTPDGNPTSEIQHCKPLFVETHYARRFAIGYHIDIKGRHIQLFIQPKT